MMRCWMVSSLTSDIGRYALDVATVIGGAAALLGLAAAVRARYRRTLGRRQDRYARLDRLGTGAQLSFFIAVLGEPPAIRRTITNENHVELVYQDDPRFDPSLAPVDDPVHEVQLARDFTECFFIDRDYYVQTISDDDETVLAFSVTARSKRFAPVLEVPMKTDRLERWKWRRRVGEKYAPLLKVQLVTTRFADLDPADPDEFGGPHFKVQVGARVFTYSEFHHFGNPGHYQTYVMTASGAAVEAPIGDVVGVVEEINADEWPDPEEHNGPSWAAMPATKRFRRHTAITTYTVIGPGLWERNYPSTFGPHGDEVRTLP